jgi:hypothetical protein
VLLEGEMDYQLQGIRSHGQPRKTARSNLRSLNRPSPLYWIMNMVIKKRRKKKKVKRGRRKV